MAKLGSLGLAWQINLNTGWGVFGLNLALEISRRQEPAFRLVCPGPLAHLEDMPPEHRTIVGQLEGRRVADPIPGIRFWRVKSAPKSGTMPDVILYALGNGLARLQVRGMGPNHRRVGAIFLEDTRIDPVELDRARYYETVLAGSTWNEAILRGHGVDQAIAILQGVDTSLFHPRRPDAWHEDRFLIFSGGALEFRKGQDIVAAAFRAFHTRHPEARLMACWHTESFDRASTIALGRYGRAAPPRRADGKPDVLAWLAAQSIPAESAVDLGYVPYPRMPDVIAQCDAAIFTSRVEGGTNLFAMQAAALGVPTAVSANTGHLDLIRLAGVTGLTHQGALVDARLNYGGTDGWGESDPDEVVEWLEQVWRDRREARRRADEVAQRMTAWSWHHQVDRLLKVLESG